MRYRGYFERMSTYLKVNWTVSFIAVELEEILFEYFKALREPAEVTHTCRTQSIMEISMRGEIAIRRLESVTCHQTYVLITKY